MGSKFLSTTAVVKPTIIVFSFFAEETLSCEYIITQALHMEMGTQKSHASCTRNVLAKYAADSQVDWLIGSPNPGGFVIMAIFMCM